ncbi:hypothetical protein [Frigoriflavimonas asaccharolytica]|uniref:Uncharacterized protein n=1 Tax=Frigoriflavimonas asaccharolytica TaxID=2735899 RepID=A0A8J8GAL8_9FLAO|nr:hypothetical protein [Frigoriflavimonas asaccharolytica]NRS93996.1 hypothetical protein [Frigoriflavimonas asaccharolytica]
METNYFENEPKKSTGFYLSVGALALFTFMGLGIDGDEFLQRETLNIPDWYFYLIFTVDFFSFLSLIGIATFRKIAVFTFPTFVILHFYLHQFYLSTFLYTDVTNMFLFVGVGLLMIIPKWKYFK